MFKFVARLFNNLPIHHKLLLISTIPLASLILVGIVTYSNLQTFSQDEERLNNLYLTQKAAAQYLRRVVDVETGFRGYLLSGDVLDLKPYQEALDALHGTGQELKQRLSEDQQHHFKDAEALVSRFVSEKEDLIREFQSGRKETVLQYIIERQGRARMSEFRDWIAQLDRFEEQQALDEFAQMNRDRMSTLLAILGGGLLTFLLTVCALYLIARSIAVPLVNLSTAVASSSGALCPTIPVMDRDDEIGGLTRVMQKMGQQIQDHFDQVVKSEMSLRKLNQDLSASEFRYRGLVDHAPIGIFTTTGMEVTFSNRHNQVLAGLDPDEQVDPATFRKRIHPEDINRVLSEFSQAVKACRKCELIFRFVHVDGSVLTILSRRVPIADLDSPDPVYVGFNLDITALDAMQSRLSRTEKLATLGQVAAGIAHELRNPLVGIGSTASLLLDEFEKPDPRRAEIEVILHETRRMDRIVNQIVEYARPRKLAVARFALSDLVNHVVKLLSEPLKAKLLTVRTSIPAAADQLNADRDQLEQVLLNLIDNSIDATPRNGLAIHITAREAIHHNQPGIMIQVKDAGKGIPIDVLSRVFEPFFTSGKPRGTGLGMAICKNIIERHRGDIHMTSAVGEGTVTSIWLPLSQDI